MLLPPFTVLVLKDTQHPLTMRITTGLILTVGGSLLAAGILIGAAGGFLFMHSTQSVSLPSPEAAATQTAVAVENGAAPQPADSIPDLTLTLPDGESAAVNVVFPESAANSPLYLWVIVNPEAATAGELVIYPRNPVFRGMPVDFRNGVILNPGRGDEVTITMKGITAGIRAEAFRVLVYSGEGDLLIDRTYTEPEHT